MHEYKSYNISLVNKDKLYFFIQGIIYNGRARV